jgi:hypothetical protein
MKTRNVLLLVAVAFAAGIATAALFQRLWPLLRSPGDYRATAFVRFDASPRILSEDAASDAQQLARRARKHAALIRTNYVLGKALQRPGIGDLSWIRTLEEQGRTPAAWLAQQLDVRHSSDYDILSISMAGDDPDQLKVLVQAVTDTYLERVVDEEKKTLLKRRDLLEQTYYRKGEELRKKREDMRMLTDNPKAGVELQRREQEAKWVAETTETIGRELERLQVELTAGGGSVQLLQEAQVTTDDWQPFDKEMETTTQRRTGS